MTIPDIVLIVFAISMYTAILVSEAHSRKLEKSKAVAAR